MRSKLFLIALGCFLLNAPPARSQQVSVKAALDSTDMLIGAQNRITLELIKPPGWWSAFPPVADTLTRAVEVLYASPPDSAQTEDGRMRLTRTLTITSFDSGYHVLPPFPFLTRNPERGLDTLYTNSLGLNVSLVTVDTTQAIKPIKGPEQAPLTFREALPWILGGLLAAALAVGIFFYFKYRKKPEAPTLRPEPKEPAHVIALRELDQLKAERLWQSGETKSYYSRLTDIIRAYIEHRFRIPALEQTSNEILAAFDHTGPADYVPLEDLKAILYLADLVKFAKGNPKPEENARTLEQAYGFVEKTMRREEMN